ncbi:WYL domain-containing protein [Patescibacteria group bacterium]|nr:WYL domain-containing protein [Patescibacteria group bacterium]
MTISSCCICRAACVGGKVLTNGDVFHDSCHEELLRRGNATRDAIEEKKNEIAAIERYVRGLFAVLAIIADFLFGRKSGVEERKRHLLRLCDQLLHLNEILREELNSRSQKLTELYDYWPEVPPDWDDRRCDTIATSENCENCGRSESRLKPLHVHHVVPISKGGSHKPSNLIVLCEHCHSKRHSGRIFTYSGKTTNAFSKKIDAINSAIEHGALLDFRYRIQTGNKDHHIVKPTKLCRDGESICLVGFCYLSGQERTFRLYRISSIKILNKPDAPSLLDTPMGYIAKAIADKKMLHFRYQKGNGDISYRTIRPTHCAISKGVNIVAGFDHLTGETRHFAPQRMSEIEIVDAPKKCYVKSGSP